MNERISTRDRKVVLIADDDPQVLGLLVRRLGGLGADCFAVGSGAAVVEAAQKLRPDLILMDAFMPEMDGFEACRALKAGGGTRDIPVWLMSGMGEPGHELAGLLSEADDYIPKPLDLDAVSARVVALLGGENVVISRPWVSEAPLALESCAA